MLFLDLINAGRNQWKSRAEFESVQFSKFKRVIENAYQRVPYYKRVFNSAGIKPEDITSFDDIRHIPILDKATIQSMPPEEFIRDDVSPDNLFKKCTGGSTGTPLNVYLSKDELYHRIIIDYRSLKNLGLKPGYRQVYFKDPETFRSEKFYQKLRFFRRYYISIFDPVEEQVEKLIDLKADIICGDPTILESIGSYLESNRIDNPGLKPKFLISTSQLATVNQLAELSSYFHAPVYNFYGAIEFGVLGSQCKEGKGIHINADSTYCEFLETDFVFEGKDLCREIICTGLDSYAMPLIRYRLGDILIPKAEACSCGRILPIIEIIVGRKNEYILTRQGEKLPPVLFTVTMRKYKFIRKFRIHQRKIDRIDILLSSFYDFDKTSENEIIEDIRKLIGGELEINIVRISEFEDDKTGKLQTIITDLPEGMGT